MAEHVGELGCECGLTRALQTGYEYDGWVALHLYIGRGAAHETCQFVAHYFGHHLAGLDALQYVGAESLGLYLVGERFGYLVVDVGVDEGATYLFERFGYVDLRDASFALEYLERPL